jgi:RHS repeat-associated protein
MQKKLILVLSQLFFILSLASSALAAPKYIVEVLRDELIEENPPSPSYHVNSTIQLESDDGVFINNFPISGVGLPTNDFYATTTTDTATIYIRGTSGNIPWRLSKNYNGEVSAGSTITGFCGLTEFMATNLSWATGGYNSPGPGSWVYQNPSATATSKIIPVNENLYTTGTTNLTTRTFAAYPGVNYYYVSVPQIKGQQRRRPYVGGTSGSTPYAYVDVDYSFQIATTTVPSRKREPGNKPGPKRSYTCGGGGSGGSAPGGMSSSYDNEWLTINQNIANGNVQVTANDPIRTRGYPLRNRIHLNTQVVETSRPMGNGTFTYDIHVTTQSLPPSGGGSAVNHWIVVDGDGQRLNFGPAASSPAAEPGVFSTLTQTMAGGYELSDAGPPEEIRKAGNYTYEFDSGGKLTSITDPSGNQQTLTYTTGKLTSVLDVNINKSIAYTYTGSLITKVSENGGGADTYLTYSGNNITKIELKESSTLLTKAEFTYYTNNLITVTRDGNAASTYLFPYQPQASIESGATVILSGVSWPTGSAYTSYNLDPQTYNSRAVVNDSEGKIATYEFDSSWNLKSLTTPQLNGGSTPVTYTYTYDSDKNMLTSSDGTVTRTYDYTANGILHKITEPSGYYKQFNYSGVNLTSVEDSIGTIATLSYTNGSLPNSPTEVEDALGNIWAYTYNAYGEVTQIDPPAGSPSGSTLFTYDESSSASATYGWLTRIEDGEGNLTDFDGYNALGDVTSLSTYVDPSNAGTKKTSTFTYDAAHRVKVITHPDSKTITNSYSGFSLSYTDDEASKRTNFTWCPDCGAAASISKPLSWAVSWNRDYDHKVKEFVDALTNKTSYSYGNSNELTAVTYPDSTNEAYEYDNYGRTAKITNGRAEDIEYSYDTDGRVEELAFPTTSDPDINFTYLGDGSVDEMTDGVGATSYEYYSNRLIQAINYDYSGSGLTNVQRVEYTYNPDYSIDTITWKDGGSTVATWTYGYDLAGKITSVSSFGETTSYTYDGQNKILTQVNDNGTETDYTYNDSRGWPTNITHSYSSTPFAEYDLTYDGGSNTVGNLTRVDENVSDYIVYAYNDLHRLTSETRTGTGSFANTFVYDLAGNLTTLNGTTFAGYDTANKISSIPSGSISNDNNGNITAVTGAGMTATTLTWDSRDKLVSQNNSSVTIDYAYDGEGRRAWSKVGSDPKTFYIFSGDKLIGEISGSPQLPTAAYTWGADGLVSERDIQNTETYWYHFGPQGETRQLTDDTGSTVNTYAYDAYGKTLSSSGSIVNPYRYAGKFGYYTDGTAGMMLAGARWYSPHLKRWISRDPINYEGGYNLYDYVGQNPIVFVDPTGLERFRLPSNPSGLGRGWTQDPNHGGDSGNSRWTNPDYEEGLEFHPPQPGKPGWRGKGHWHTSGPKGKNKEHLEPGEEVDCKAKEYGLFDQIKNGATNINHDLNRIFNDAQRYKSGGSFTPLFPPLLLPVP